jgi:hypothetical protein
VRGLGIIGIATSSVLSSAAQFSTDENIESIDIGGIAHKI